VIVNADRRRSSDACVRQERVVSVLSWRDGCIGCGLASVLTGADAQTLARRIANQL